MIRKKTVLLAIFLIAAALTMQYASALTPQINRHVAVKAFPNSPCQQKLLEGAVAPTKSENWIANPDFKPKNWLCYNNDENCSAKLIASKYLQKAVQETDQCKKEFNQGIYTTFWGFSQTPSNWLRIEPTCQSQFEQQIEKKITQFEIEWQVLKECPIMDEEGTIALSFSNTDLNRIIETIQIQWNNAQKDLNILIPVITEEEKGTLYDIIQQLIDQNKISTTAETVNIKALQELWDYSCFLSTKRKQELYENWLQLDFIGKNCLTIFLAQKNASAYSLAANCYSLGAGMGTAYNQQALAMAQWELMQYARLGFGESRCRKISIPVYLGEQNQFTQTQQTQTSTGMTYEVCDYVPKNVPQGCVQEFMEKEKETTEAYNTGKADGILQLLIIIVIGAMLFYFIWTRGD